MSETSTEYDIAIIGGGLAGLASAIELKRKGHSVILFEKNKYPFHKVCGEYVSMEARSYLNYLGLPLEKLSLPIISQLKISTPQGIVFNNQLKKGGIGISRFLLDHLLSQSAEKEGVIIKQNTSVNTVRFKDGTHTIQTKKNIFNAKITIGAYGKRSKLDMTLNRKFNQSPSRSKNFVGIKYHIKANLNEKLIGLHLFKNGYCGISKVEGEDKFCMCYLSLSENLNECGSIEAMEQQILSKNPYLKKYLNYERINDSPLTIAKIYFGKKSVIEDHIFMLGDSAGLIAPLSGNGMSMAMHSAHYFSSLADDFLRGKFSRSILENKYRRWWNKQFHAQLKMGKLLQYLFYQPLLINPILYLLNKSTFLGDAVIRSTHGKDILTK